MNVQTNRPRTFRVAAFTAALCALVALIALAAEPESPAEILDKAKPLQAELLPRVAPADKAWIDEQARKLGLGQMDENALQSVIELRFPKQPAKPNAVDSTAFLVVLRAISFADLEIAKTQAELEKIKEEIQETHATIRGTKTLLDDLKGKLDGLNEMSEMTSLRLQMTMDRRSKFIQTLSNIMKKVSSSQDAQTQNIK